MFAHDPFESQYASSQLKALAGSLDGILLLIDAQGVIQSVWAEATEHPLLTLNSCLQQKLKSCVPPKIWAHFEHKLEGIAKDHERRIFEFSYKHKDQVYFYQIILNDLSEQDNLAHISIMIRDITQLQANREALRQGQASLHALVSSLDDLVFLLNTSGVFLNYWTSDPKNLFIPPEQFLGKSLETVFNAETARMFRTAITWVLHSRKPQTVDYPLEEGRLWLEATISAVEAPDMPIRISILVKNITRRKQAEIALRRFQEGLTTLNQISFDPQINATEQVQEGLKLMLEYFHLTVGLVSKIEDQQYTLLNLVNLGPDLELDVGTSMALNETFCQQIWQKKQIVAERDLQASNSTSHPHFNNLHFNSFIGTIIQVDNQPYGTISFFDQAPYPREFDLYDIEFLRIFARWISFVLEQELQKNELIEINQNKERIMDIIAHDLRNPMGAVRGLAEYALHIKNGEPKDPFTEILQGIVNGSNRALQLLESLLKAERIAAKNQAMSKVPYTPTEIIKDVLEKYQDDAQALNIELKTQFETRAYTMLDTLWMTQAIENLLNNALKYTPSGGSITFSVLSLDGKLRITVKDTGIGIPAKLLPHIFDKFTQAKRLGLQGEATTGLGLYLVKQIIELHQGKIWCESQENQGSIFYIELPSMALGETPQPC